MQKKHFLFTPGPLTTTLQTKQAMLEDWGSWDSDFYELTKSIGERLINLIAAKDTHVFIPMQGSGSFAVESALGTLVHKTGKVLVPNNGAYCARIIKQLSYLGRECIVLNFPEDQPFCPEKINAELTKDKSITHVVCVHCETSSGILNPLSAIAKVVVDQKRDLIIDAMSTFGALPICVKTIPFTALICSPNKCFEGVPGMGFVLVEKEKLLSSQGNSHSLCMDLYEQYTYLEKTHRWRYTPPTHVLAAFKEALVQYDAEGGQPARLEKYTNNKNNLIQQMYKLGIKTLLSAKNISPIIVSFCSPKDKNFSFNSFYNHLKHQGFIIYPGKITIADTFRIGCMGDINNNVINDLIAAINITLKNLNINN